MTRAANTAAPSGARAEAALAAWAEDAAADAPGGEARGAARLGLAALALVALVLGGWGLGGRLAVGVAAPGIVLPAEGAQALATATPERVAEVIARPGDRVAPGAILLRFDDADLAAAEAVLAAEQAALAARRARLEAEAAARAVPLPEGADGALRGEARVAAARLAARAAEDRGAAAAERALAAELRGIAAERAALGAQRRLAAAALADTLALARRGIARRSDAEGLEREVARLDGLDARLAAAAEVALARRAAERQAFAARRDGDMAAAAAALADLAAAERAVAARGAELALRRARMLLRAPVAGLVAQSRPLAPGEVVAAGETLFTLLPEAGEGRVLARLEAGRGGAVHTGMAARIVVTPALPGPPQDIAAEVLQIAPEAVAEPRTGARAIAVTLRVPDGAGLPRPGTPVAVHLVLGEVRPLAWLAEPLLRTFARAFRDG